MNVEQKEIAKNAIRFLEGQELGKAANILRILLTAAPTTDREPVGSLVISETGNFIMTRTHSKTDRALEAGSYDLFLQSASDSVARIKKLENALQRIALQIAGDLPAQVIAGEAL